MALAPSLRLGDPFPWGNGSDSVLIELVQTHFHQAKPGYKPGVVLVPVPAKGFFTSVVEVTPQNRDHVGVIFGVRRDNETLFLDHRIAGVGKVPAVSVEIVLYSHDILNEDGDASTDLEYEIVSINPSPTKGETPMDPVTMARNFQAIDPATGGFVSADLDPSVIEAMASNPDNRGLRLRSTTEVAWKSSPQIAGKKVGPAANNLGFPWPTRANLCLAATSRGTGQGIT